MYKKIQRKNKNGKISLELEYPEYLLRENYKCMSKIRLRSFLVQLIIAEKRARNIEANKKLIAFSQRLKRMRLEVACYYKSLGGNISPLVLNKKLPSSLFWPGIVRLVHTKAYEEYLTSEV